jgi:hypothetical protein
MELNYKILGNQPEPSLTQPGLEIIDFEVRTKDANIFEQGKYLIERYISDYPELEGTQLVIDDPMTVGLYPSHDENGNLYNGVDNPSPYGFNSLVLKLEELGFYGKAAGYVEVA